MTETSKDRPLVTFALFAYNQEQYVREAVEGAFAQTYEPMEIILSDDCSSDRTFQIMQEMAAAYQGPHEVKLRQNHPNQGIARHVNQIIASSSGKYLVASAGDDISLAERTEMTVAVLQENQSAAFCETAYIPINEAGAETPRKTPIFPARTNLALADLLHGQISGLTGAARTYRLSTIQFFPPLEADCPTEDSPFVLRCLLHGRGIYIPDFSIRRRTHGANLSGADSMRTINLDAISIQYGRDIEHAHSKTIISPEVRRTALSWARRSMFKRKVRQRQRNGTLDLWSELRGIFQRTSDYADWAFLVGYLFKVKFMERVSG
jgi:glycosyltransferase involved in cell wall biosynthesis